MGCNYNILCINSFLIGCKHIFANVKGNLQMQLPILADARIASSRFFFLKKTTSL